MTSRTKHITIKDKHLDLKIEYKALIGHQRLKKLIAANERFLTSHLAPSSENETVVDDICRFLADKVVSWNLEKDGKVLAVSFDTFLKLPWTLNITILKELDRQSRS